VIGERVVILGGPKWVDRTSVELLIKSLADGTVVLVDDDPFTVQSAAIRQARCSHLVAGIYRLPGGHSPGAVVLRRKRDDVLFRDAQRAIVFGDLAADREATLEEYESRGLQLERIR
jgi:hypothetical protein